MKAVKSGGLRARRFGLRLIVAALACALVLTGASLRRGASAQQKSPQGGAKSAATGAKKIVPMTQSRSASKGSNPKTMRTPNGDETPQVLGCSNATTAITIGQTVNGSLSTTDCVNPVDSSLYDAYSFNGTTGQQIVISMNSTQFDTYLYLMLPGETTLRPLSDPNPTIQDDDGGGGTNTRIPANTSRRRFPRTALTRFWRTLFGHRTILSAQTTGRALTR
jgi:hypothetical protein